MRAFGIFAAFAAFTSAFAAPVAVPANALSARDGNGNNNDITVSVNIVNTVQNLKVTVDGTVAEIKTVLHTVTEVDEVVKACVPLVIKLTTQIAGTIVNFTGSAVTDALSLGGNTQATGNATVGEVKEIVAHIVKAVTGILCDIIAIVGKVSPLLAGLIQSLIATIVTILKALAVFLGKLDINLDELLAPVTSIIGVSIPALE